MKARNPIERMEKLKKEKDKRFKNACRFQWLLILALHEKEHYGPKKINALFSEVCQLNNEIDKDQQAGVVDVTLPRATADVIPKEEVYKYSETEQILIIAMNNAFGFGKVRVTRYIQEYIPEMQRKYISDNQIIKAINDMGMPISSLF